jgi:signal transduction histidine kinase
VRLTVRDNGVGMEPSMAGRIFEPGYSSWRDREGTGLGLSIVREIVKRHQGEIHVESAPGAGAAFHIDLPVSSTGPDISTPRMP